MIKTEKVNIGLIKNKGLLSELNGKNGRYLIQNYLIINKIFFLNLKIGLPKLRSLLKPEMK